MNKSKENTQKATANKAINKEEKNMRTQNTATANLKATFKGYKPTTAREFKTLTATEKRDTTVTRSEHSKTAKDVSMYITQQTRLYLSIDRIATALLYTTLQGQENAL